MRAILVIPDPASNQNLVTALAAFPAVEIVRQVMSYPAPDDFLRILAHTAQNACSYRPTISSRSNPWPRL
jgi:hypothetical protein